MGVQQIFVELIGEGTIVYRPVFATHIFEMIFKIEGIVPETEVWSFLPEEIVECKYHQLNDGKTVLTAFRSLSPEEKEKL
jgi:hypothetical protein